MIPTNTVTDRPTSITLPITWKEDSPEDFRLFLGPLHVADVCLWIVPDDKWMARAHVGDPTNG